MNLRITYPPTVKTWRLRVIGSNGPLNSNSYVENAKSRVYAFHEPITMLIANIRQTLYGWYGTCIFTTVITPMIRIL